MKGTRKKKNTLRAKTQKKKKEKKKKKRKPIVALKKWVSGRVILFCNKCFR